jgi:hypothetical protein
MNIKPLCVLCVLSLAGCATRQPTFTRVDGQPVNPNLEQSTLAQCRGEAAAATVNSDQHPNTLLEIRGRMVEGCMARNGYLRSDQGQITNVR